MEETRGPDVTEAELGVLEALWANQPCTIRQLADSLYPSGWTTSQYATVQKLLDRLEAKKCVSRDRSAMTHVFSAAVDRDTLVGGELRAVAERLCGGSMTPLLTHLLSAETLSEDERKELRRLLNQPRRPNRR